MIKKELRREPPAPEDRRHRSLLPSPLGQTPADRGKRGRARRPGEGRQGQGDRLSARCRRRRSARRTPSTRSPRVQTEYSLWTRNAEVAVLDTCRELGIAFVAFSPLARGFFGPASFATCPRCRRRTSAWRCRAFRASTSRGTCRCSTGCRQSPASMVARWRSWRSPGFWRRATHIIPIPGTTRLDHLEENARADQVRLSPAAMAQTERADQPVNGVGRALQPGGADRKSTPRRLEVR